MNKSKNITLCALTSLSLSFLVSCNNANNTEKETKEITINYFDTKRISNITSISINNESIVKYEENTLIPVGIGQTTALINDYEYTIKVLPAEVDVVLFTGQSNMVGKDTEKYTVNNAYMKNKAWEYRYFPDSPTAVSGFYEKDPNGGKLVEVTNPTGENFTTSKTNHAEKSSGSNLMPQFCEDYVRTGRRIVGVHVARGGKEISIFTPNGDLNKDIMAKYQGALDYVRNDPHFTVGRKFYLMLQGESDTNNGSTKQQYITNYMLFHNSLKQKFGMEFGALIQTGKNTGTNSQGIVNIAQAKFELAMNHDDIIMANTEPLTYYEEHIDYLLSDYTHYKSNVMKSLGTSVCDTVVSYLGYNNKNLKGVEPGTYISRTNHITSIEISGTTNLSVNATTTLNVEFGVDKNIFGISQPECDLLNWKSSDESIATVDKNGKVTALKNGTVKITASSVLDNVTGEININIQ